MNDTETIQQMEQKMAGAVAPPPNCPMAEIAREKQAEPSKLKKRLLSAAEIIDAFRLIPRLILVEPLTPIVSHDIP